MARLDRTGWAWEWLRRDPEYEGIATGPVAREARAIVLPQTPGDPARGLLFRRESGPSGQRSAHLLWM